MTNASNSDDQNSATQTQREEYNSLLKINGFNSYTDYTHRDKVSKSILKQIDNLHSSLYIQNLVIDIKVVDDTCYVITDPCIDQMEGRRYISYMPPRDKFLSGTVMLYENYNLSHPLLIFHCYMGKKDGLLETYTYNSKNGYTEQLINHYVNGKIVKTNQNEYWDVLHGKSPEIAVPKSSYSNHPDYKSYL